MYGGTSGTVYILQSARAETVRLDPAEFRSSCARAHVTVVRRPRECQAQDVGWGELAAGDARSEGWFRLVVLLLAGNDDDARARRPQTEPYVAEAALCRSHAHRLFTGYGEHHLDRAGVSGAPPHANAGAQGDHARRCRTDDRCPGRLPGDARRDRRSRGRSDPV